MKTAAKVATGAMAAFGAATTVVAKNAVRSFAEYEQLVGGVETLFKSSAKKVQTYAARAYSTAGLSANQYMSTVTSFSASLLQSLGNDTEKVAKYADRAIVDMADNANKMGTSIEMIQNAYQGFAKQNYTMLDNLKLGYGGTKTEMQRLIKDAAALKDRQKELGVTVDANSMSFANIVNAIHVVQAEMGIYGATAQEASTTVEGSINSMKAAWENLITGIGTSNANIDILLNNFLASVQTVAANIGPVIDTVIDNILTLLINNGPAMIAQGGEQLNNFLVGLTTKMPDVINFMINMVVAMGKAILNNIPYIIAVAISFMRSLLATIIEKSYNVGSEFISSIMKGAKALFGDLVRSAMSWGSDMVQGFVDGILSKMRTALDAVKSLASNIRSYLHFSRPDTGPLRDYETWMPDFMSGLAKGINSNKYKVIDAISDLSKDMDFGEATINGSVQVATGGGYYSQNSTETNTNVIHAILEYLATLEENMGENLRNALDGMSIDINKREFGRLVRGVT